MNLNITARDFKFFILGILTVFLVAIILDWDHFKKGLLGAKPNDTKIEKVE